MNRRCARVVRVLGPLGLLLVSQASLAAAQTVPAVVTFDTAWKIIRNTHFDSTFNGVDWNRVRDELRPRAEAARNNDELRAVLLDMVGRLKQSHFSIIPKDLADSSPTAGGSADLGLDVRWIENAIVVTAVEQNGPAAAAGVQPGWILKRVGRHTADSMIARAAREPAHRPGVIIPRIAAARLSGAEGSAVELEFNDAQNRSRLVTAVRRPETGAPVKFGNLPTFYMKFNDRLLTHDGVQAGVIYFNVWMVPLVARIDSAVDRQRAARGIVIDLRGNPGGVGAMAMGVAGHFLDSTKSIGAMSTRRDRLEFRVNPRLVSTAGERVQTFGGPVAILTDELSGSTSEVFAGGLQSIGRARVFGATSMGAVLPAAMDRLPNGDVLYHAIADFVTPDGTLLEGRGVIPDQEVPVRRADLLAGRDPVLEAALRWIASEARRTTTMENRK